MEIPSSGEFAEASKNADSFEAWGRLLLRNMGSDASSLQLHVTHVMRALGPVYTEELRQCIKARSRADCQNKYALEAFLIRAEGFEKGVFFVIAPPNANIRARNSYEMEASSMAHQIRSLRLNNKFQGKKKKNVSFLSTGAGEDFQATFGEESGMLLLPVALQLSSRLTWTDSIAFGLFFTALGVGLLYLCFRMASQYFPKNYGSVLCGKLSSMEQVLADAGDRYLGLLAPAEVLNTIQLQNQILEDIGRSAKYGILLEEGGALLSQSWLIAGNSQGINVVHIGILTVLQPGDATVKDRLIAGEGGTVPVAGLKKHLLGALRSRIGNATWQNFQILRQLDCRCFAMSQGQLCELDSIKKFPIGVAADDFVRSLLPDDGTVPHCTILKNGEPCKNGLFVLPSNGKHVYSVQAFIQFLKTRSRELQLKHENQENKTFIYSGPERSNRLAILDDPLRIPLDKSTRVEYLLKDDLQGGLLQTLELLGELMNFAPNAPNAPALLQGGLLQRPH